MNPIVAALHLVGRLPSGRAVGKSIAPLVWIALWSHAKWGADEPEVYPSNATLAERLGTSISAIKRGIKLLRDEGLIETRLVRSAYDRTRRYIKLIGRGPAPVVRLPDQAAMHSLWRLCKAQRVPPPKAAGLVALATMLFSLAAEGPGAEFDSPQIVRVSVKALRAMLACPSGGSFYARLGALERAGVIRKAGATWRSGFVVMPAAKWVSKDLSTVPANKVRNVDDADAKPVRRVDAVPRTRPAVPRDEHVDHANADHRVVLRPPSRPVSVHGRRLTIPGQHLGVPGDASPAPRAAVLPPLWDPTLRGDPRFDAGLADEEVDALLHSVDESGCAAMPHDQWLVA